MSMVQDGEWSPARIAVALASLAFLLKTQPWSVIPRLTSRGVPASALPRLRLLRRRMVWLAVAVVATLGASIGATAFANDPLVKWSLFGIAVATLLEVLKVTLDLRRFPPRSKVRHDE